MGPPDKREPKLSKSTFEHAPLNMDSPSTIVKSNIKPNIVDVKQEVKQKDCKDSTSKTSNTDFLHVTKTRQIRNHSASSEAGISPVIFRKVMYGKTK